MAPTRLANRIAIRLSEGTVSDEPVLPGPIIVGPRGRGPGWYRGDLHSHTLHSDGGLEVAELVRSARDRGLDFQVLTDHNTVAGLAEFAALSSESFLTLGGMELTTFYGHCLAVGLEKWMEWRGRSAVPMADLVDNIRANRGLAIIAHPGCEGYPSCTGCRWDFGQVDPGKATAVEVWAGNWGIDSFNERSLAQYYDWLNSGHVLRATSGMDIHVPSGAGENVGTSTSMRKT